MGHFSCRFLLVLLVVAVCSAELAAQDDGWQIVQQIAAGEQVKIVLNNGKSHKGVMRSASEDAVVIGNGETYQNEQVRRVLVKKRGHRGRNALIGLGIGAGTGLGVGAAIDNDCSPNSFFCTGNSGKAVLTPLFGGVGAGIGALIPTGGWREVYKSKQKPRS